MSALTRTLLCLSTLTLPACKVPVEVDPGIQVEARGLDGRVLERNEPEGARAAKLEADLESAMARWEVAPEDETALIWVGRRTAYLGRYQDAIAWYSDAIETIPASYRLLRHRGHRYISVRELDRAIEDLTLAMDMTASLPDEIEADGAPNKYGIPRSTTNSNITYHLGLAHYLKGEYELALPVYERCLEYSSINDDMWVATAHWTYMTLRKLGRHEEARELAMSMSAEPEILENEAYLRCLRLYRGEMTPEEALGDGEDIQLASAGYGVAAWYIAEGETERGLELCRRIEAETSWAAFGHLGAEAELLRAASAGTSTEE